MGEDDSEQYLQMHRFYSYAPQSIYQIRLGAKAWKLRYALEHSSNRYIKYRPTYPENWHVMHLIVTAANDVGHQLL